MTTVLSILISPPPGMVAPRVAAAAADAVAVGLDAGAGAAVGSFAGATAAAGSASTAVGAAALGATAMVSAASLVGSAIFVTAISSPAVGSVISVASATPGSRSCPATRALTPKAAILTPARRFAPRVSELVRSFCVCGATCRLYIRRSLFVGRFRGSTLRPPDSPGSRMRIFMQAGR